MSRRMRGEGPREVDVHVGRRVRALRREARISLEALAAHLGITYQQVQKYERGANRVSASTLYEIAMTLRVPLESFFAGLPAPVQAPEPRRREQVRLDTVLAAPGGPALLEAFLAMPKRMRGPLAELACCIAELEAEPEEPRRIAVGPPSWG